LEIKLLTPEVRRHQQVGDIAFLEFDSFRAGRFGGSIWWLPRPPWLPVFPCTRAIQRTSPVCRTCSRSWRS